MENASPHDHDDPVAARQRRNEENLEHFRSEARRGMLCGPLALLLGAGLLAVVYLVGLKVLGVDTQAHRGAVRGGFAAFVVAGLFAARLLSRR